MLGFHIWTVAKYEMITLTRSWFFRIFGIIALVVLFFYNLVTQAEVFGSGNWDISIIPAGIPYMSLLILNMAQAIIAAFLASDFLKRDKKLDTTEVIYMRSMSNVDYVLGKTLGNLIVFLTLNLVVLVMVAIFNLVSQRTGFDGLAYLQYLLFISIPTLIFILGLSFLIMSVIRNQGITFLLLLGYIALTVFYLKGKVYYLFDYMAYNVPMMKSEIAGFGNMNEILIHRGIYLLTGIGFIFWTIVLLKRLPQSKPASILSTVFAAVFVIAGFYLGYLHVSKFQSNQNLRGLMIELNNDYANFPVVSIQSNHLRLEHLGNSIKVRSDITIQNTTEASREKILLSLNPGLEVLGITNNGQQVDFFRDHHLLFIQPEKPLAPGQSASFSISYEGNINEAVCYLDMDIESRQDLTKYYQNRYAFLSPDYLMLTPETNWYPTGGVTYSNSNPGWLHQDFTDFTLDVRSSYDLMPVSQGVEEKLPEGVRFTPENSLPFLSLLMGNYEKKSLMADSVEFIVLFHPDHDYFVDVFPELKDTLSEIISERLQDYERKINLRYPYKRFTIVEVPVQYASFQHVWSGGFESVQPEMVLIPEMGAGLREANFAGTIDRMERRSKRGGPGLTKMDYEVRALNNFAGLFANEQGRGSFNYRRGQMQTEERANPYYIFPNFYNYVNYIAAEDLPIFNRVLESYLKSTFADMRTSWMRQFSGISEDEKANMALQEKSFSELLSDPEKVQIIDNVIKLKGEFLFSSIKATAGKEDFETFLYAYLEGHKFNVVPFSDFANEIDQRFNIDLQKFIDDWFQSKALPGFIFSPVTAENVRTQEMMKTMVEFKVSNLEPVPGIVKINFRIGGGGRGSDRGGFGGPGEDNTIEKLIFLEGNQNKEISYLLDQAPRAMTIQTLTSKNIPLELINTFRTIEDNNKKVPFEGEVIVDDPVDLILPNEIIVDNEDPEFTFMQPESEGFFAKLLSKNKEEEQRYQGYRTWRIPVNWTLTTNSKFFGRYVRSAYYTRQGAGDRKAIWNVPIPESGYYEVYFYMESQQAGGRGFVMKQGDRGGTGDAGKYQFIINHDDGQGTPLLDLNDISGGWNSLGSFYFSPDTAVIELTNLGDGRQVIADAVKLVKQDEH